MRLIDADALDYALGASDEDIYFHHMLEDAPTIDAIPVEWLEQKRKCSDPESVRDINGAFVTICIDGVLVLWQKEQGAR